MKRILTVFLIAISFAAYNQNVAINPTISPALFQYNTTITVTYDVTGTSLAGLSAAYIWAWTPGSPVVDSKWNVNPATATQAPAKFTKTVAGGTTTFSVTFKPSDFFTVDISGKPQLGMLLKGTDWSNGQTADFVTSFTTAGTFEARLIAPVQQPLFVSDGETIDIDVQATDAANYTLSINNVATDTKTNATSYTYSILVSDALPSYDVKIVATSVATPANTSTVQFSYLIHATSPAVSRPSGIIDGINYSGDATKATLSLIAPLKSSVYVIGDFTNWKAKPEYLMKKDGEHFWLEVSGLTSGTEYGYQYLVDETLFVADPYADKILDPDDQYIPATTYPNLKPFPTAALHSEWYFNRVSILQTNQTPFVWTASSYVRPAKEKLVIYELIVRDFFGSDARNYQHLIDTIGYFKRLGVTAIELMPVTEFNGNDSWGYNPTFMFAPDKYYGTKNKLKEFIDLCHKNNIAVILDIVMNQQDMPNPYVLMYYNFAASKPAANNPWFNVDAKHPFNVFYDLNHESQYTKNYLDTVNYHWIHDYKVDGLRFDLSKGFTQTFNTDVGAWGAYDASRIAILKRMSDKIWSYDPDSHVILEHFADNSEETELANYRADEGKGMMLWSNFNGAYNQMTMGFATSSDISGIYYGNKGWSKPRNVGYMESHDEERLMFKNISFGNSQGSYNVRTIGTGLDRMKAAGLLFYTIPGPKMLWEFGELGYDKSINTCSDGTTISNDCRVSAKPVLWNYQSDPARQALFNHTADLLRLRKAFSAFTTGTATVASANTLTRSIVSLHQPYNATPTDSTELNAVAMVNLDVTNKTVSATFPHTGTWYDYYDAGSALNVSNADQNVPLGPGEFKLYTDVKITHPVVKVVTGLVDVQESLLSIYPNPTSDYLSVEIGNSSVSSLALRNVQGVRTVPERVASNLWDLRDVAAGFYVVEVTAGGKVYRLKVIRK